MTHSPPALNTNTTSTHSNLKFPSDLITQFLIGFLIFLIIEELILVLLCRIFRWHNERPARVVGSVICICFFRRQYSSFILSKISSAVADRAKDGVGIGRGKRKGGWE